MTLTYHPQIESEHSHLHEYAELGYCPERGDESTGDVIHPWQAVLIGLGVGAVTWGVMWGVVWIVRWRG